MKKIPKEDLFCIFYVRGGNGIGWNWNSYYNTLDALRPLLEDAEFGEVISGFYLNHIDNSVRISYFVNEARSEKAMSIFRDFFKRSQITEIDFEKPRQAVVAEKYGGYELEEGFRHFLALETRIGLELAQADLTNARILFATYCFQVRKALLPVSEHFEPNFVRHSPTYASLSLEERERFLKDLERVSWAHMMVNFVLGCDFQVIQDGLALSISQINEILRANNMGFQVPLDWRP
jgi:hypothetical protein